MADDNRALTYAEMREQNLFTDAVVKSSSGREWPVHQVVMSRAGRYFSTAFTFPCFSGTLDLGVSDDVVQVIIDLAYEGMCRVDVENVLEVLSAAFMYQLESLIEICVTFVLNNTISSEHVLDLKVFVRDHQVVLETFTDGDLIQIVNKFIRKNFIDLYERSDVYKLSVQELDVFLKEDDLNIPEKELLEFVLKYVVVHQLNTEETNQLLANVRLEFVDPSKLEQIADENPTLRTEIEARGIESPTHLPRYPREIVLVTGGFAGGQSDEIEIFNMRTNEWKLTEINGMSPDVILGSIFYEFKFQYGGWIKIRSFDIKSGHSVTVKMSELPHDLEREYFEVLAWNEGIVAFMGHNNAAYYNPGDNSWSPFPAKKSSRKIFNLDGTQSVVVDGNLFSIGGYDEDEEGNGISRNIRYFDAEGMRWILCGYLKENPESLRLEVVDGKVYVISMTEQYAECFQPTLEDGRMRLIWFPNIQLPWKYECAEISVVDNKILFTGGIQLDKEDYGQRECIIFSPRNGEWSRVADLHGKRFGHKAFTINTSELDVDRIHQLCCGELVVEDHEH